VSRYVMANQVFTTRSACPVRYVISNPSSYAYLDANRPSGDGPEFRPYGDARNCTAYDNWPYGLRNRTGAAAKLTEEELRKRIVSRPGDIPAQRLDTLPLAGSIRRVRRWAQGPSRLARGQSYAAYLKENFGARGTALR